MTLIDWPERFPPLADPHAHLMRRRVPEFLGSAEGRGLTPDPDATDGLAAAELMELEHRFGTSETPWTPTAVARLLLTWSPTSGVAVQDPQRLLHVLRALISHTHAGERVPREMTVRSIAVIEALGAEFVERVHWGHGSAFARDGRRWSRQQSRLRELALTVGGGHALLDLHTTPLPEDGPLDLAAVPDDLAGLVLELDGLIQAAVEERWDGELVTATRRALVRLATSRPEVLRRRAMVPNTALGVAWAVGSLNEVIGTPPAPCTAQELAHAFGATNSRGHTLLDALGGRRPWGPRVCPGRAELLTSERRTTIVTERDELLAVLDERGVAVSARDLDEDHVDVWAEDRW